MESILVDIGLAPNAEYRYRIVTPFIKIYEKTFTTGADGSFTILTTDFPEELFNPWLGSFVLTIFQDDNCEPTSFIICEETYTTIIMRFFVAQGITQAKIGCECPEEV